MVRVHLFRPFGKAAIKSFIIEECHQLSKSAWNSLLLHLEEPPPWVRILLCTTEPNKVPETVKTRCARYELKPVSRQLLFDLVQRIAKLEKAGFAKKTTLLTNWGQGYYFEATTKQKIFELIGGPYATGADPASGH